MLGCNVPVVCRNIPNRTTPRRFSARDAARVARYAAEYHGTRNVSAAVIAALGTRDLCCLGDCCGAVTSKECQSVLETALDGLKKVNKLVRNPIVRAVVYVVLKVIENALSSTDSEIPADVGCDAQRTDNRLFCNLIDEWERDL